MSRDAKYRLAFNAPGARGPGAPSGGDFQTLAGTLAAALVIEDSGSGLLGVTCGGLPVMNGEDLREAVGRLRAVAGECPDDGMIPCAARVLREMGLE
jgi:hypothetical protein